MTAQVTMKTAGLRAKPFVGVYAHAGMQTRANHTHKQAYLAHPGGNPYIALTFGSLPRQRLLVGATRKWIVFSTLAMLSADMGTTRSATCREHCVGNPRPHFRYAYFMMTQAVPFDFAYADYPLAPATLYRVGGPARLALIPRTAAEAREAYAWMTAQPGKKLVLGGGSNVLIDDAGFDGIVLFTERLGTIHPLGNHRYRVETGVALDTLVKGVMLPNNYVGVGGLTGIPGSVGGAIYMNAGTVNGSTCAFMESVTLLTPEGERTVPMTPERFSYRGQDFCRTGDLIVSGIFTFAIAEDDQMAIYEHYKQRRIEKQPQGYCCGSVFKNPAGGHAGRLIESCGLKGTREGGAIISPMHANFIMNDGNASARDILALIDLVKRTVKERHGIALEEEVRVIK